MHNFKPGQKIRLIDCPLDSMPLGTIVEVCEQSAESSRRSVCFRENGRVTWRPAEYFELVSEDPVRDEQQEMTMQIEAGEYYRTRDGRKVGPMEQKERDRFTSPQFEGVHLRDGLYGPAVGETEDDLVAEWTEGPVRTETVTKRRIVPGVYGRLEVGDRDGSELSIRLAWRTGPDEGELMHPMTATELDDLAMVASQLAEALRDGLD